MNGLAAVATDTAREIAAMTGLLETEYAVIYGLAAGGGQLAALNPPNTSPWATIPATTTASFDQHRLRRDRLIAILQSRQATAPVALSAYPVTRSDQPGVLLGYLADLAQSTIVAYRGALDDLADPGLRTEAVAAVIEASRFRTTTLHAAGQNDAAAAAALPGS